MTGKNHIVGGVAFTGVFCSFWDVNIFKNPWYVVATLFFAILPDLDHSNAPISKALAFTRLPQYLDRNYGHRTITHSLIVYFSLMLLVYIIESFFSATVKVYTLVFSMSYLSHLIFDMMTVSGVPLFFPFKKNPCVLPGNPDYRLRVADKKSEWIVFFCFCGIIFFCYPLMKNGFWTSFNRSFGTLEHVNKEYKKSVDWLIVDYNFIDNGNTKKGKALLVNSSKKDAVLFDSTRLFVVNDDMIVKSVKPRHTGVKKHVEEIYFHNIKIDSLEVLISDKIVVSLDCQSTAIVEFWNDKEIKNSKVVKLEYAFNPSIEILEDTSHTREIYALEIKQIELREELESIRREQYEYQAILNEIERLNDNFDSFTLTEQENVVKRLKTLRNKKLNYSFSGRSTEKVKKQIEQLQEQINQSDYAVFSGKCIYYNF